MSNKIYYLFGERASNFFADNEDELSTNEMANCILIMDYALFEYDELSNRPSDLLEAFDGWNGFAEIGEQLYKLLKQQ